MDGQYTTEYDCNRHLEELCLLNACNGRIKNVVADEIDEMMERFFHTFFDGR